MKILMLDWFHWTFGVPHLLKQFLRSEGVECSSVRPTNIKLIKLQKLDIKPKYKKAIRYYRGFDTHQLIKTICARETNWYDWSDELIDKYVKEAMFYIDWSVSTFQRLKPDYIVIEGGLTHHARTCLEVARNLDIGIIAVENSFIKDKIYIEFNTGYICNRFSFARTAQDWLDCRYLPPKMDKEVKQLIKDIFKTRLHFKTEGNYDFKVHKKRPVMVVPLQVAFDQVILYDTKFNNQDFIDGIFFFVCNLFHDWDIILKCHPKEEKVPFHRATGNYIERHKNKPANIFLIRKGQYSTQELLKEADLVVVNTTQAGLEGALLGKPVVVMGDAFYSNKGFTIDLKNFNDPMWGILRDTPENFTNIDRAKLFFWYFYRSLYDRKLSSRDKSRIKKRLNI